MSRSKSKGRSEMNKDLSEYRSTLVQAEQKSIESYDKSLLTLSGGALAISLVFIGNVIGESAMEVPKILISAWICLGLTISFTLASFYLSHLAMRKAVKQVDDEVIYTETPGGRYTCVISILNALDGSLFIIGMVLIGIFMAINLR